LRTLGIDLASQPDRTAACLLAWSDRRAAVERLETGVDDDRIVALAARAEKVGVDAPLGWPDAFVDSVSAYHAGGVWRDRDAKALQFRATDRYVREQVGLWPLSVSTDRIGIPAMRAARLLARLGDPPRDGSGLVVEVYPAAALARWGLAPRGYKGRDRADARRAILATLRTRVDLALPALDLCEASDDALDAMIAAVVARDRARGVCDAPVDRASALREGWIALPPAT
jgi:predicted nuclease with RNAse H fold